MIALAWWELFLIELGEIWVSFHEVSKCAFTISYGDLLHSLDFARKHGAQID